MVEPKIFLPCPPPPSGRVMPSLFFPSSSPPPTPSPFLATLLQALLYSTNTIFKLADILQLLILLILGLQLFEQLTQHTTTTIFSLDRLQLGKTCPRIRCLQLCCLQLTIPINSFKLHQHQLSTPPQALAPSQSPTPSTNSDSGSILVPPLHIHISPLPPSPPASSFCVGLLPSPAYIFRGKPLQKF